MIDRRRVLPPEQVAELERLQDQMRREAAAPSGHLERVAGLAAREVLAGVSEKLLTKDEAEEIAIATARKTTDEMMWTLFGVEPGNRKDEEKLRNDMTAMRGALEFWRGVKRHGFMSMVGIVTAAFCLALWIGVKSLTTKAGV